MDYRLLAHDPQTWAVIFEKDDEFTEGILEFAEATSTTAADLTAVGAFRDVTLGYFDPDRMDYRKIHLAEQVEVVSFIGNITAKDGRPKVHAHAVVACGDGTTFGGHVLAAHVWPTMEVVATETPAHLRRIHDDEMGLALIDLSATEEIVR